MSEEKKWSNALNKPWFNCDDEGLITDLENSIFLDMEDGDLVTDALNELMENSIRNADLLKRAEVVIANLLCGRGKFSVMKAQNLLKDIEENRNE